MNEPDDETSTQNKHEDVQKAADVDDQRSAFDSTSPQNDPGDEPADFNDDGELVHYPLPQQPKKSHKALWIWLVILVLLIGGAAAGYWWYKHKHTNAVDHVIYGSSQATGLKQLCFLRLSYLVCTDMGGCNRVRYDWPAAPTGTQFTSLTASADQSTFIAFASNYAGTAQTQSQVVVLNGALASPKQLTFPAGLTPSGQPTLSADGKTAYLELDGANNNRQIYSYDIATGKAAQLTASDSNSLPKPTKNGHIIYSKFVMGSDSW